eukprot:scaffold13685_cov101-Isochrysis_galbana.AAC.3
MFQNKQTWLIVGSKLGTRRRVGATRPLDSCAERMGWKRKAAAADGDEEIFKVERITSDCEEAAHRRRRAAVPHKVEGLRRKRQHLGAPGEHGSHRVDAEEADRDM